MEQIAVYTLRPVQEEGEALLLEIYSSTRAYHPFTRNPRKKDRSACNTGINEGGRPRI